MSNSSKNYDPRHENKITYKPLLIIIILAVGYQIYISEIIADTKKLEFGDITYDTKVLVLILIV